MGVTVSRRGPKLILASVLAGGALIASATAAFAWAPPEVKVKCDSEKVAITLTDANDYATAHTLDFTGPNGSFKENYDWGSQPKNTSQTFTYPLGDFPNGDYTVHPAADSSSHATRSFKVDCIKSTPPPPTTASAPRTNTPPPSGGGQGAATPGLPNTGFDPNG
jgi:hypothetical protein